MTTLSLSSGDKLPIVGLGTWKAAPGVVRTVVHQAIRLGYRHIDCACDYGNEEEVGQGIKDALDEGICSREELFVTSKLWNTFHAREHVEEACRKSLSDLGLDYLDLYLIHFPIALKYVPIEKRYPPEWIHDPSAVEPKMEYANVSIQETWEAMEDLVEKKLVRNIGVSNFSAMLIMDMLNYAKILPAVNQVEIHPFLIQENLIEYCHSKGIAVTAYSCLGSSSYVEMGLFKEQGVGVLKNPQVLEIAKTKNKSPAQVVLRWNVQRGVSVIPKTSNPKRLEENKNVFDFELSMEEMEKINGLDLKMRYNDPGVFCKFMGGNSPIHS